MQEIQIYKMVITIINFVILGMLPVAAITHGILIKKQVHWSLEWWQQIMITIVYIAAINAEIPAMWSRLKTYYQFDMTLPESIYVLTTWDRYGHGLFYLGLYLLTWMVTYKHVPKALQNTLG